MQVLHSQTKVHEDSRSAMQRQKKGLPVLAMQHVLIGRTCINIPQSNMIGDGGAYALLRALCVNSTLKELYVSVRQRLRHICYNVF